MNYKNQHGSIKELSILRVPFAVFCLNRNQPKPPQKKIDCFTLAIGPVEHDFAIRSARDAKTIVGRLLFSVEFQQIRTTTVNLGGIKFEFDGKHEHNYYFTLQAQTPESTIDSDMRCHNIRPVYESEVNRTFLQIGTGSPSHAALPSISFQTTYSQMSASCLKILLWAEPEKLQAGHLASADKIMAVRENEYKSKHEGEAPFAEVTLLKRISLAEKYESDTLVGEFYISFPKLLGEEMKIFDQKDATLIHKHIVWIFCEKKNLENPTKKSSLDRTAFPSADKESKLSAKLLRHFNETMWYCGKVVGKVTGSFLVKDLPFFKQMLCGVHTEEGFCVLTSSVLRNENTSRLGFCDRSGKLPAEVIHCLLFSECKKLPINR